VTAAAAPAPATSLPGARPDRTALLALIYGACAHDGLPVPDAFEFQDPAARYPGDYVLCLSLGSAEDAARWRRHVGALGFFASAWHGWGVAVFEPSRIAEPPAVAPVVVHDGGLYGAAANRATAAALRADTEARDARVDELVTLLTEPTADEIAGGAA